MWSALLIHFILIACFAVIGALLTTAYVNNNEILKQPGVVKNSGILLLTSMALSWFGLLIVLISTVMVMTFWWNSNYGPMLTLSISFIICMILVALLTTSYCLIEFPFGNVEKLFVTTNYHTYILAADIIAGVLVGLMLICYIVVYNMYSRRAEYMNGGESEMVEIKEKVYGETMVDTGMVKTTSVTESLKVKKETW